jgi:putative heme iron utilization protein
MVTPELGDRVGVPRRLLRGARAAVLATEQDGQPYAALVTPACMGDLSVVLLLSELSVHTRQLRGNARCSLMCVEEGAGLANPQMRARVSLTCTARLDAAPELRARYLEVHPYAGMYAGFTDFAIWRLSIVRAHVVAGFAQAWSVEAGELLPPGELVRAIAGAEAEVLAHCNADHAGAIAAIGRARSGVEADWRLVGIDVDGCDLAAAEGVVRVGWPHAVGDIGELRGAIMVLAQRARGGA